MVKTAYAPAVKELSLREQRVKAIDDKRAADNRYYNNWLNSQHQALASAAQAGDQALEGAAQSVQAATGAAYDQAKQGAIQQLSQLPGTVSDFSHANALGQIDAHKGTAVGQVGATAGQALAGIGTGQGLRELAGANNFATIAALEAKRTADTWGGLQDLSSERLKLSASQAGDTSKAIQDALGQELTKAQSNRDYSAVMERLGQSAANNASLAANRRSGQRHAASTLAETIRHNQQMETAKTEAQSNSDADFTAKWGVSRDTFLGWSDTQRQSYLQRARERGIITGGAKGSKGAGTITPTQLRGSQRDYRAALAWAQSHKPTMGEIKQLTAALTTPTKKGETVHDPATGKIVYNTDGTAKKAGGGGFGLKDPLLARAVAEVAIYGGVDAKLRAQIKDQYGLTLPASKKKVTFKPKAGAPTLYDKK